MQISLDLSIKIGGEKKVLSFIHYFIYETLYKSFCKLFSDICYEFYSLQEQEKKKIQLKP